MTAGTAAASKALVLDGSKNIATIGTVGCGAITSTGNSSFAGGVTVGGDFTVNGSTVTVDATTLNVADKNITIASGSTSSATMDGAGLNFGLDAAVAQLAYRHSDTTLTSSVDLGAPQFHSSIATGTAPLTVQSTTVVANLNAATVAGKTMAEPGAIGGTTAAAGTFTDLTATANIDIDDSGGDGAMDGVIIGAATAASATFTTVNATTFDATTDFTIDGLVLTADTITNDAALSVVSTGLTLDASLDIALSADGGNVTMDDGTTTAFDFNVDDVELKIHDDAQVANYASIAVGDNGATTFTTVDADAAAANLQITADGTAELAGTTVTLDSGTNVVLSPADGSHIKLDDVIQVDSGVVTGATSITSTAFVGDITGDVTGTSDLVTITDKSDSVNYDVLFGNSTSAVYDDTGTLTYNPGTATLSATSASITYISASKVEVDSTSLTIGGTALTKTILDNLQSTSGTNTGDQNTFLTVVSDSGTATADATGDALSILGGTGITTAVDYGTDAVTITSAITAGDGLTLNTADIDIDAAQTTITSIINNGLSIGGYASHQLIDFSADDMIKVSVNNVADEFRFAAGGTFHANSDVVAYSSTVASDMNLKENITDMKYGLDTVMQLRGVEYDWKREDMGHDVGVLAQEVESVIPEIVKEHEGLQGRPKFKAVDYNKLVPVLIESIKELKSQIDELKLIKN